MGVLFSQQLKRNISLAQYTSYKIGGPAKFFYEAKSEDKIVEAVAWARKNGVPFFILGGGSNILVSDKGFDGLVIRIKNSGIKLSGSDPDTIGVRPQRLITADAGADFQELIKFCVNNSLAGIEWASGIPGTFGGAVRGNAGAFGGEIKDILTSVKFLDENGKIRIINNKDCNFSYRSSIFKQNPDYIILCATLKLKLGNKKILQKMSADTIALRASRHPLEYASCGSIFKAIDVNQVRLGNFDQYPKFRESIKKDPFPVVPAACFIDEAGLKNYKIGGAMVSDKHPNFFVNYNRAKADDVMMLISFAKTRLLNEFGVMAEEEVQIVGF